MTLPEPGAASPVPPDRTRLLDIFLARRSPRTLAAYQADFEDFRGYMGVTTVAEAAEWLIIDGYGLGYRVRLRLPGANDRARAAGHDNQSPPRSTTLPGQAGQHARSRVVDLVGPVGRECASTACP